MDRLYSVKGKWGIGNADRGKGYKRYDPHARKYREWEWDQNWGGQPEMVVPGYTRKEHEALARRGGKRLKGKDFVHGMPRVSFIPIPNVSLSHAAYPRLVLVCMN